MPAPVRSADPFTANAVPVMAARATAPRSVRVVHVMHAAVTPALASVSTGLRAAGGVPALERDIFIDAVVNADFIRRQVRKLIDLARERGTAVGIGHPHPETIAVLREMRAELLASGVELVPISALVRGNPATGAETALAAAPAGKNGAVVQTADRKTATP